MCEYFEQTDLRDQGTNLSAAGRIKRMIIDSGMRQGDRLPTERELMNTFKVSRSALREAMNTLKAENVIISKRGSGTFVSGRTGISDDPLGLNFANQDTLLRNLLETRMLIEPQVAALAAQRAHPEDVKKIWEITEEMKKSCADDSLAVELDIRFHTAVAECMYNEVLARVVPIINESIIRGRSATVDREGSLRRAVAMHYEIYDAIRTGDSLKARYLTECHIRETMNNLEKEEEKHETI